MKSWLLFFLFVAADFYPNPILEQFSEKGYAPLYNKELGSETFDRLYSLFDRLIDFCDRHPQWTQSFSRISKPFHQDKEARFFGTHYIGYRNESQKWGRTQISFYYSSGFHHYLKRYYPQILTESLELAQWLEECRLIVDQAEVLFEEAAERLNLSELFKGDFPILLKTIKYFPESYNGKAHFDTSALSLFFDSTNNSTLLLAPFREPVAASDFSPVAMRDPHSFLLIPGTLLKSLGMEMNPTPHVVLRENKIRYATVAFLMIPNYYPKKIDLPHLPHF